MPDLASGKVGGKVFMVSSLDPAHPGENVIDGNDATFWISTGLYPQEILLELGQLATVSSVSLSSTRVRCIRLEGWSQDATQSGCTTLAEGEMQNAATGRLQKQQLACGRQKEIDYVRLVILSGWDDFCTVHNIQVDGEQVEVRREPPKVYESGRESQMGDYNGAAGDRHTEKRRSFSKMRSNPQGDLEVSIPEPAQKGKHEPDAPRKPDNTSAWRQEGGRMVEVRSSGTNADSNVSD